MKALNNTIQVEPKSIMPSILSPLLQSSSAPSFDAESCLSLFSLKEVEVFLSLLNLEGLGVKV